MTEKIVSAMEYVSRLENWLNRLCERQTVHDDDDDDGRDVASS